MECHGRKTLLSAWISMRQDGIDRTDRGISTSTGIGCSRWLRLSRHSHRWLGRNLPVCRLSARHHLGPEADLANSVESNGIADEWKNHQQFWTRLCRRVVRSGLWNWNCLSNCSGISKKKGVA